MADVIIRVLLVDDHPVVIQGMSLLLSTQEDIEVVATATSGAEALAFIEKAPMDVVVLDLNMPNMNGIETCRQLKAISPSTQVVVLTSHHQDAMVYPAIKAGALSYLLKSSPYEEVIEAVRAAARGEAKLHPRIAQKLMQDISGERPSLNALSARELEVLTFIAQGMDNKTIAKTLALSSQTIKVHVSNILSKLYLEDRTQAAIYALKEGIVPLDE